jgi:hypothetical protein
MAFKDLAEGLAEIFGQSDGMLYELAVACTIKHEKDHAYAVHRYASMTPAQRRTTMEKKRNWYANLPPEKKEIVLAKARERSARPEARAKNKEWQRRISQDPEKREAKNAYARAWIDALSPEDRARLVEQKRASAAKRRASETPEEKERRRAVNRAAAARRRDAEKALAFSPAAE